MDKKDARQIVREWMSTIASDTGWHLARLTLWYPAASWRIGVRLRPSTMGPSYFIDCLLFMDSSSAITGSDVNTIMFPLSTLGVIDSPIHDSVDFSRQQSKSSLDRKARAFRIEMCEEVLPGMSRFQERSVLDRWMEQNPYLLTAALRKTLGISAPHD